MLTLKVFFLIYWKNFLSNIVKNLKIREYKNLNSNIENIKDPSDPKNTKFSFHKVNNENIEKEIRKLHKNKAYEKSENSIRIIKDNANIFDEVLRKTVYSATKTSNHPNNLKLADITHPYIKKAEKKQRKL